MKLKTPKTFSSFIKLDTTQMRYRDNAVLNIKRLGYRLIAIDVTSDTPHRNKWGKDDFLSITTEEEVFWFANWREANLFFEGGVKERKRINERNKTQ